MRAKTFKAFCPAFVGDSKLEYSGRILLPASYLEEIMNSNTNNSNVMTFLIKNPKNNISLYVGVFEFTSEPGCVILPFWMMSHLGIEDSWPVTVSLGKPKLGKSATFQPLDSSFNKITNQRVVLEKELREHPCLNQGTILPIKFGPKIFHLKVLQTEPDPFIFCFKTDLVCDFAPAVTEFVHRWFEEDSDSDNEKIQQKTFEGRTRSGKTCIFKEELKKLHSNKESRERDRKLNIVPEGVRKFELGKEILPPRPDEDMNSLEKKTLENKEFFVGQPHLLKRTKSTDKVSSNNIIQTNNNINQKENNQFVGRSRTLNGIIIPDKNNNLKIIEEKNLNKEIEEKNPFIGKSRNLKGQEININKIKIEKNIEQEGILYKKNEENIEKIDPFKGEPKTLKK